MYAEKSSNWQKNKVYRPFSKIYKLFWFFLYLKFDILGLKWPKSEEFCNFEGGLVCFCSLFSPGPKMPNLTGSRAAETLLQLGCGHWWVRSKGSFGFSLGSIGTPWVIITLYPSKIDLHTHPPCTNPKYSTTSACGSTVSNSRFV